MVGDLRIFVSALITIVVVQAIKLWWYSSGGKGVAWKEAFADGGIISAHSAIVSALCFSVYFAEGISNLFFVSLVFAMIVLRDAVGVRRIAKENAVILDKKFKLKRNIKEGHSVAEIFWGILVGGIVSALVVV